MSLRGRLLVLLAALLAAALTIAGALITVALSDQLTTRTDEQLRRVVAQKAYPTSVSEWSTTRRFDVPGPAGPDDLDKDDHRGVGVKFAMPYLNQWAVSRDFDLSDPATVVDQLSTSPRTITADDGERYRAVVVSDGCGDECPVIIALPTSDNEVTLTSIVVRFLLLALGLLALVTTVGYFAIGRAFGPLREVETVAGAFGEGDTSRRVQSIVPGTEVGRLGTSMNAMLDQIETTLAAREASEQRMRRFVGDASHELRTPLSTVRGYAELYRMGAVRSPDDVSSAFRRIEDESRRMSGLVEDLLRLARLDEQRGLSLTSVDLLVLVSDAESDAAALAPDRTVRMTGPDGADEPSSALVTGDEQQLRQVITNLLANAIRHTPAGTPIELGVGHRDGAAVVQVVDHGSGVPADLAERIFERFYRADSSRSRGAGGGSGLGLAIVAAIVGAHAGTARVFPTPGGGATFEVRLPLRKSSQASPSFAPGFTQ